MEQRPAPFCDDCIVPLTVRHILVECPTYNDMRPTHFPNIDGNYDEAMRSVPVTVSRVDAVLFCSGDYDGRSL